MTGFSTQYRLSIAFREEVCPRGALGFPRKSAELSLRRERKLSPAHTQVVSYGDEKEVLCVSIETQKLVLGRLRRQTN